MAAHERTLLHTNEHWATTEHLVTTYTVMNDCSSSADKRARPRSQILRSQFAFTSRLFGFRSLFARDRGGEGSQARSNTEQKNGGGGRRTRARM